MPHLVAVVRQTGKRQVGEEQFCVPGLHTAKKEKGGRGKAEKIVYLEEEGQLCYKRKRKALSRRIVFAFFWGTKQKPKDQRLNIRKIWAFVPARCRFVLLLAGVAPACGHLLSSSSR